jgi:hypothetical protein
MLARLQSDTATATTHIFFHPSTCAPTATATPSFAAHQASITTHTVALLSLLFLIHSNEFPIPGPAPSALQSPQNPSPTLFHIQYDAKKVDALIAAPFAQNAPCPTYDCVV